jgi:hypothetical protein
MSALESLVPGLPAITNIIAPIFANAVCMCFFASCLSMLQGFEQYTRLAALTLLWLALELVFLLCLKLIAATNLGRKEGNFAFCCSCAG